MNKVVNFRLSFFNHNKKITKEEHIKQKCQHNFRKSYFKASLSLAWFLKNKNTSKIKFVAKNLIQGRKGKVGAV